MGPIGLRVACSIDRASMQHFEPKLRGLWIEIWLNKRYMDGVRIFPTSCKSNVEDGRGQGCVLPKRDVIDLEPEVIMRRNKLGLRWAKLSTSWNWTSLSFSVDMGYLNLFWSNWLGRFGFQVLLNRSGFYL